MHLWLCVLQDYGLDISAFGKMVSECPQRLLELAASCCLVSDLATFRVYQMDTHFLCQLCLKTNKPCEKGSQVLPLTVGVSHADRCFPKTLFHRASRRVGWNRWDFGGSSQWSHHRLNFGTSSGLPLALRMDTSSWSFVHRLKHNGKCSRTADFSLGCLHWKSKSRKSSLFIMNVLQVTRCPTVQLRTAVHNNIVIVYQEKYCMRF